MDEGIYWVRVQCVFNMMDIWIVFVMDVEVDEILQFLKFIEGKDFVDIGISFEQVEVVCKIKDVVVYFDMGEKIFFLFCVFFIILCNFVVDILMILVRGIKQNVVVQWLNQIYNCLYYYVNWNVFNQESVCKIFEVYVGVIVSFVGVVVGLYFFLDKVFFGRLWYLFQFFGIIVVFIC